MNPCHILDCNQLRIFLIIWELRNITKAASCLNLSQPTVSTHLKALEEQLGTLLFERTSKGLEPTRAARILYPHARRIMRLNRTVIDEIAALNGENSGYLDIGASNIPGQYLLPKLLAKFKADRWAVDISLKISDTAAVIRQVDAGEVEIGLVGAIINNRRVQFQECFDDELLLIVGNNHRLSRQKSITLEEVLAQPLVIREKGSGTRLTIEMEFEKMGLNMDRGKVLMELGSTEAIRQAVKAGIGCAFLSKRAVIDDISCGLLHPVQVVGLDIRRKFYIIRSKNRVLSPVAKSFIKFVNEAAQREKSGV